MIAGRMINQIVIALGELLLAFLEGRRDTWR